MFVAENTAAKCDTVIKSKLTPFWHMAATDELVKAERVGLIVRQVLGT
jgi:hypothetical protein